MAGEATGGRAARRAAAALVAAVLDEGRSLADLTGGEGPLAPLAPPARAQAQRLTMAALRHLDAADATLAPFLQRQPPGPARHVLRLAVVDHFAAGTPVHAAVNEAVALLRADRRTTRLAGLGNAVLRRALATPAEAWAARPPQRLPGELRGMLRRVWGKRAVAEMELAQARGAPLDLTPRDPAGAQALAEALGAALLPTGSLRLPPGQGAVSALPGYAEGAFWVQDAAAALPAGLLQPAAGARVLDLCAAPGGKTLQLAAADAQVTALDASPARLARLEQNLARTGLKAGIVATDALDWEPPDAFDAILLDAPCSATGTIRRHPDLPFRFDPASLDRLVTLQAALIDRAVGWLRPGGRLVYAVCSLLPAEGEAQAAAALDRHPGLRAEPAALPGVPAAWSTPAGGIRTRPDQWAEQGGLDGFFMMRFCRTAA